MFFYTHIGTITTQALSREDLKPSYKMFNTFQIKFLNYWPKIYNPIAGQHAHNVFGENVQTKA